MTDEEQLIQKLYKKCLYHYKAIILSLSKASNILQTHQPIEPHFDLFFTDPSSPCDDAVYC